MSRGGRRLVKNVVDVAEEADRAYPRRAEYESARIESLRLAEEVDCTL